MNPETLSKMRGAGIGLVFATYILMCLGRYDIACLTGAGLIGLDIVLAANKFETVSQRIHSWFGKTADFAVMALGLIIFGFALYWQATKGYILKWSDGVVMIVYFTAYGHLWWYADR